MNPIVFFSATHRAKDAEKRLIEIKSRLRAFVDSLEGAKMPKYSGWYVCLGDDPDSLSGYKFLGFFNPDECAEDGSDEPEWTLCIPIWDKESIPEFLGW